MRWLVRKFVLCLLSIAITTYLVAGLAGLALWGHWFDPPTSDSTARTVVSIERYSSYRSTEDVISGNSVIDYDNGFKDEISGGHPSGRLSAAINRRGIRVRSEEQVSASTFAAVRVLMAERGYTMRSPMYGRIAEGRSEDGQLIVLAAFSGPEISNDHYPYYEIAGIMGEDERIRVIRTNNYRFDFAGGEGMHRALGIFAGLGVAAGWLIYFVHCFGAGIVFRSSDEQRLVKPTIETGRTKESNP